jgi:glycosyltransferase involved in cell wall biosynthesis
MRVLYLINTMSMGGAESVLRNLIMQITKAHPDAQLEVAVLNEVGHFGRLLAGDGISIRCLGGRGKYDPRLVTRLAAYLREGSFDLVHVHLFPAHYVAACCSLLVPGQKWVYTEHDEWNRRRDRRLFRVLESAVYSRYERVVAVSKMAEETLSHWLPQVRGKTLTIQNGVPIPAIAKDGGVVPTGRELQFLYAGRLLHKKGVDVLLRALSVMKRPNFALTIAGDGDQRQVLERMSADLHLSSRVRFLGVRHDLPELMRAADCLVMPSRWEGLPMVMLEAMALGLPVIATPVGGIPEVIEDGINGYLVPLEDTSALARRLDSIVENPGALPSIGRLARERIIEEYSVEKMAEKHWLLYREVLGLPAEAS